MAGMAGAAEQTLGDSVGGCTAGGPPSTARAVASAIPDSKASSRTQANARDLAEGRRALPSSRRRRGAQPQQKGAARLNIEVAYVQLTRKQRGTKSALRRRCAEGEEYNAKKNVEVHAAGSCATRPTNTEAEQHTQSTRRAAPRTRSARRGIPLGSARRNTRS